MKTTSSRFFQWDRTLHFSDDDSASGTLRQVLEDRAETRPAPSSYPHSHSLIAVTGYFDRLHLYSASEVEPGAGAAWSSGKSAASRAPTAGGKGDGAVGQIVPHESVQATSGLRPKQQDHVLWGVRWKLPPRWSSRASPLREENEPRMLSSCRSYPSRHGSDLVLLDSNTLAQAEFHGRNSKVVIFDIPSGTPVGRLGVPAGTSPRHSTNLTVLCGVSSSGLDSDLLVSFDRGGQGLVWDWTAGLCGGAHGDPEELVSSSSSWMTGKCLGSMSCESAVWGGCCCRGDRTLVVTSGSRAQVWDVGTLKKVGSIDDIGAVVEGRSFSRGGGVGGATMIENENYVLAKSVGRASRPVGRDKSSPIANLIDMRVKKTVLTLLVNESASSRSVCWANRGGVVLMSSRRRGIEACRWDFRKAGVSEQARLSYGVPTGYDARMAPVGPDGNSFVSPSDRGYVLHWDFKGYRAKIEMRSRQQQVYRALPLWDALGWSTRAGWAAEVGSVSDEKIGWMTSGGGRSADAPRLTFVGSEIVLWMPLWVRV